MLWIVGVSKNCRVTVDSGRFYVIGKVVKSPECGLKRTPYFNRNFVIWV